MFLSTLTDFPFPGVQIFAELRGSNPGTGRSPQPARWHHQELEKQRLRQTPVRQIASLNQEKIGKPFYNSVIQN